MLEVEFTRQLRPVNRVIPSQLIGIDRQPGGEVDFILAYYHWQLRIALKPMGSAGDRIVNVVGSYRDAGKVPGLLRGRWKTFGHWQVTQPSTETSVANLLFGLRSELEIQPDVLRWYRAGMRH